MGRYTAAHHSITRRHSLNGSRPLSLVFSQFEAVWPLATCHHSHPFFLGRSLNCLGRNVIVSFFPLPVLSSPLSPPTTPLAISASFLHLFPARVRPHGARMLGRLLPRAETSRTVQPAPSFLVTRRAARCDRSAGIRPRGLICLQIARLHSRDPSLMSILVRNDEW